MPDDLDSKLGFFTENYKVELTGLEIMSIICGLTMYQLLWERNNLENRTPPSKGSLGEMIGEIREKLEMTNPGFFKPKTEVKK